MRIVTKFNIVLAAMVGASVLLNLAALDVSVGSNFRLLEEQDAQDDHARVIEAIGRLEDQAKATAGDYGFWDETVNFATGKTTDYATKYITAQSMQSLGENFILVTDRTGRVLADEGYIFSSGADPAKARLLRGNALAPDDPLMRVQTEARVLRGIVLTDHGIATIAAAPIRLVAEKGEANGVLVVAAILDQAKLETTTKVELDVKPIDPAQPPVAGLRADRDITSVTSVLTGLDGKPAVALTTRTPRSITALGTRTIWTALGLVVLVAALLSVVLGWLLRRVALSRIEIMRRHLIGVADSGLLAPMRPDGGGDELSQVVDAFNSMTGQLAELREKLRKTDYDSGAADHASAVMHNIRNAITPINAIAADLAHSETAAWKTNLAAALAELKQPGLDPDRSAKLSQFLALSTERLLGESEQRKTDLSGIGEMVRQISEMLNDHAAASRADQRAEAVDPIVAFRHARRIVERRRIKLDLAVPATLPPVRGRAALLSEVFANLFINAAESIEATGRQAGRIAVSGEIVRAGAGDRLRIAISDDGDGIEPDMVQRIFENGFSTKGQASRGLGLHWSANAIIAMGGTISAASAGKGRGATFLIELPTMSSSLADAA